MCAKKYQPYGEEIVKNILSVKDRVYYIARIRLNTKTGEFEYSINTNVYPHFNPPRIHDEMLSTEHHNMENFYKRIAELQNILESKFKFSSSNTYNGYTHIVYKLRATTVCAKKYEPYGEQIVKNILSVKDRAYYIARIVVNNQTGEFYYSIDSNVYHDPVRISAGMLDTGHYNRKIFYKRIKELEKILGSNFKYTGTNHDDTYSRFIYELKGK